MTALVLQNPRRTGPSPHRTPSSNSTRSSFAPGPSNPLAHQRFQESHRSQELRLSVSQEPSSSTMPSADIATVNGAGHASQSANKRRTLNIDSNHDAGPSSSKRPSSAPGVNNNLAVGSLSRSSTDVSDSMAPARPTKPALLRSKSEYAALRNDEEEHTIEERREWGARHGFEDHYQSQDIISQLANVRSSHSLPLYLRPSLA